MSCSAYTDFASQPIDCKFPCPCTKCKNKKRLQEMDQKNGAATGEVNGELNEDGNRLFIYLSNIINILVFILFSTCMLWVYVLKWFILLGVKIYNLDRRTQKILAIFFSLLILSTCLNVLIVHLRRSRTATVTKSLNTTKTTKATKTTGTTMKPTVKTKDVGTGTGTGVGTVTVTGTGTKANDINQNVAISKTVEINKIKTKSAEIANNDSGVSWWNWCERKKPGCLHRAYMNLKPKTIKPRSYSSIPIFKKKEVVPPPPPVPVVDTRAKEVYDQSKLYAVPMEMKRPPALLAYIVNFFRPDSVGDIGNI